MSTSNSDIYRKLLDQFKAVKLLRPVPQQSNPWNDAIFENKFLNGVITDKVPDLATGISSAKVLLNWYFGEKSPENPDHIILTVFYAMTLDQSSTTVFSSKLMTGGEALEPPEASIPKLDNLKWKNHFSQHMIIRQKRRPLTLKDVKFWYGSMWDLLNLPIGGNELKLKLGINLIGFMFMMLLRSSCKDIKGVCHQIFAQGMENFSSFWKGSTLQYIVPPDEDMVTTFSLLFRRFQARFSRIFAACVYSFGHQDDLGDKVIIQKILRVGCLSSLELTGLGILAWMQKAISVINVDIEVMLEMMESERHLITNIALNNILKNHVDPEMHQYSWAWARMFDDCAFQEISIRSDPVYGMTMLALYVNLDENHKLWDIPSMKLEGFLLKKARALQLAAVIIKIIIEERT